MFTRFFLKIKQNVIYAADWQQRKNICFAPNKIKITFLTKWQKYDIINISKQ